MIYFDSHDQRLDARSHLYSTAHSDYNDAIVRIDEARIRELELPRKELTLMSTGLTDKPVGIHLRNAIGFLLILNAQNFRFWDLKDGKFIRYSYEGTVGALGMRKAFDLAWGDCSTARDLYWALCRHGIAGIFGDIPAKRERKAIMEEMLRESHAEFLSAKLAIRANEDRKFTLEDARDIAEAFPVSYADPYLKKAQLTLAEIAGFGAETGLAIDCSELTLCADYQLPRVLRALGVFQYSEDLARMIDSQVLIEQGSAEERALRAATILAGEMMAKAFGTTPAAVDNFLWTNRSLAGTAPFHLTETTAY